MMQRQDKKYYQYFTFFVLSFVLASSAAADSQKLKLDSLEKKLEQVDRDIARFSLDIRHTRRDLDKAKKQRRKLQLERAEIQSNSSTARLQLEQDLREAYLMVRQHPLKLVMNQNQAGALGRTLAYYQYYNQYRTRQLKQLGKRLDSIQNIDSRLALQTRELDQLLNKLEQRKTHLESSRRLQKQAISDLQALIQKSDLRANRLKNSNLAIKNRTLSPNKMNQKRPPLGTAFAKLKGRLQLPVKGSVTKRFGNRRGNRQLRWQGLLIQAKAGTSVHSVASGTVVFSDWIRGYGFLAIIDHGNEYMSLYGHNQNLLVETGQTVEAGQTIATVGNSGGYPRSALYFELRKKGKPFNPVRWLARLN